eukprot:6918137-Pyramimonas_sp.AAC.2
MADTVSRAIPRGVEGRGDTPQPDCAIIVSSGSELLVVLLILRIKFARVPLHLIKTMINPVYCVARSPAILIAKKRLYVG